MSSFLQKLLRAEGSRGGPAGQEAGSSVLGIVTGEVGSSSLERILTAMLDPHLA